MDRAPSVLAAIALAALSLAALSLAACDEGPSDDLVYTGRSACVDPGLGTQAHFDEVLLPDVFGPYCLYCHSTEREGEDRHGAPADLNYDDYASATSRNATTWARVASAEMPPLGALPSQDAYRALRDFLDCSSVDNSPFEADLGDCEDPAPAYADIKPVFDEHCTRCHHSALAEGADRSFAPPGADWDQPAAIRARGPDLIWRFVFRGDMPLGADYVLLEDHPDDARALYRYLSCGAPD